MRLLRKLKWLFGTYLMPRHIATVRTKNGILRSGTTKNEGI